jgi:putative ABC transport system substrate-binding protein
LQRLRELGFSEGRNLVLEVRTSEGRVERLPELGAELARQNCDLLLAPGNTSNLIALKQASRDTPIIAVAFDYDLEATGLIDSLARPGGRITGVSALQSVLPAKRLELLKELLPKARRIAVFSDPGSVSQLEVARAGAKRLGVELKVHEFKSAPYDYQSAFAEAARAKADALLVLGSANFVGARQLIPNLAQKHRLPAMFHNSVWADAGGLLSYGPNFSDILRLAADQVSKILNGAKPAELPVEQPTTFELVINLKTAKALGMTIPQSIRFRADRMIE